MNPSSRSTPPKPVSMQVIADQAGVTRALVSMAMRNSPKVAAATRERILAIARELNYRPNPMVRALMSRLRNRQNTTYRATIAFVTNLESADFWKTLHVYPEYFQGASDRARELGYHLEHFWLGEHRKNPARFSAILQTRGIPGLIIAPLPRHKASFQLDIFPFSAVTFGYSLQHPRITRICNHHFQTVQDAVQNLQERGYQKIGFALSESDVRQVNYLWMAGVQIARSRYPTLEFSIMPYKSWTLEAFQKWLRRENPEVVVAVNMDVWRWIENLRISIPKELGFLHLDCLRGDTLSGMCQNTYRLGVSAMEILAGLVENNSLVGEDEPKVLMLSSMFNPGTTLLPPS